MEEDGDRMNEFPVGRESPLLSLGGWIQSPKIHSGDMEEWYVKRIDRGMWRN